MSPFDVFTELLKVNPRAGRFIAVGGMVLSIAALVAGFGVAEDVLIRTAIYLLVFSVVVFVLANLKGLPVRIIGWCVTVCFMAWLVAVVVQMISNNGLRWLAPTQCLVFLVSDGCSLAQRPSPTEAVVAHSTDAAPKVPDGVRKVFIQFAGSIDRKSVVSLAQSLNTAGWPIAEAAKGGERTGNAIGFNEVRFFHREEQSAAVELAKAASSKSPAGKTLTVRDLSRTRYSKEATEGLLEIWISN